MCRILALIAVLLLSLAQSASAQVNFQLKYPEGEKFQVKVHVEAKQKLGVMGNDAPSGATTSVVTTVDVGKRMPDGSLELREKVTELESEVSLPGGIKIAFDSREPDKKPALPQLEVLMDVYRTALENTTTKVLDKDNKVQSVRVSEEVVGKLDERFRQQFDVDKLKKAAVQEQNLYPQDPINVGDTWERTEVMGLEAGQSLTLERSYEYTGTVQKDGQTLDRIVGTTKTASLKQNAPGPGAPSITSSGLKVESSDSEMLFDRELGATVFSSHTMRVTGDVTLSIANNKLPAKVDLTIKATTERSLLSSVPQATTPAFRTWTDATGEFSVEAAFVSKDNGKVQLKRRSNGQVISVSIDRLSDADRKFLEDE